MTPQTPPTDRPLTAGDVPLLRRGDILDHHGDTVTVDRVGDLIQYSGHGSWGNDAPEKFAFVSRPAASEGAGSDAQWLLDNYGSGHPRIQRIAAALASPPVSERERELEGALAKAVVFNAYRAEDPLAIRIEFVTEEDRLAAANAIDRALAAQPQEPV